MKGTRDSPILPREPRNPGLEGGEFCGLCKQVEGSLSVVLTVKSARGRSVPLEDR